MKNSEEFKSARYIAALLNFLKGIKGFLRKINARMEGKYPPSLLALAVTAVTALTASAALFVPNCLGVAADGSADDIMKSAGIYYMDKDPEDIYNNYFVKTYTKIASNGEMPGKSFNSQVVFLKLAKSLDDAFTGDNYFDIRFLGLLYLILYLPAVYLIMKQACQRVKQFSEGIFISAAGLLIFSDVGYVTYFNSFYPEAVWLITMLYCAGAAMSFQKTRSGYWDLMSLLLFFISGMILVSSRRQCAVIGFLFAVYMIRLTFVRRNWNWTIGCVSAAFVMSVLAVVCVAAYPSDFSETSKFHAMTRGVLFGSPDPAKTLEEFGIDSSYELLTDASAYDYLPLVKSGDDSLYHGFMDKYTIPDISVYYLHHPGSLLGMIDVSIGAGMDVRRSNCGNYEKTAGFPEKARSLFWSVWSSFKMTSAPRTVGYLFLLTGAVFLLFYKGYSIRPEKDRRNTVFLDMLLTILAVLLSQSIVVIVNSGDAEMVQRMFLVGLSLDIMTYCVFAELLHKLRIV
ncbi:hypothetical protein AALB39_14975 [Lachnospiraceae bacterium 54-53]